MIDSWKVLKGLDACTTHKPCQECPYCDEKLCSPTLMRDAFTVLKERVEVVEKIRKAIQGGAEE